ncbi:hypothetical protein ACFO0A_03395 [Novosphingobium tardum]|uniref:Uncharacterized protein n=1 Tax=Novosphingobium tardum TaxID=1538021 RepID=A0ABV8RNG3_9SPHN
MSIEATVAALIADAQAAARAARGQEALQIARAMRIRDRINTLLGL